MPSFSNSSRERLDTCDDRLVEVCDEFAQLGELPGARFIGNEVAVERWMVANPVDQGIELLPLYRII